MSPSLRGNVELLVRLLCLGAPILPIPQINMPVAGEVVGVAAEAVEVAALVFQDQDEIITAQ